MSGQNFFLFSGSQESLPYFAFFSKIQMKIKVSSVSFKFFINPTIYFSVKRK